jgi:hypothetical protein
MQQAQEERPIANRVLASELLLLCRQSDAGPLTLVVTECGTGIVKKNVAWEEL